MANPSKFYLSHMNAKTKYRATWDPTKQLKIGYIGKLEQGILSIYSSLEKEGIRVELATDPAGAAMDYTSHDDVSITAKLSGTAPAAGSVFAASEAGFSFEFKSENSIVFQTGNHKIHQLVNLAEIEDSVLEKYKNGNWDKDWVIVTELVEADTATIIISNSSNGSLELKARTDVRAGQLTLTDASLGLSVVREKGSTLKYITQSGLTPLYRVMGIRHPFLGSLSLGTKGYDEYTVRKERQEVLIVLDFDEREFIV